MRNFSLSYEGKWYMDQMSLCYHYLIIVSYDFCQNSHSKKISLQKPFLHFWHKERDLDIVSQKQTYDTPCNSIPCLASIRNQLVIIFWNNSWFTKLEKSTKLLIGWKPILLLIISPWRTVIRFLKSDWNLNKTIDK